MTYLESKRAQAQKMYLEEQEYWAKNADEIRRCVGVPWLAAAVADEPMSLQSHGGGQAKAAGRAEGQPAGIHGGPETASGCPDGAVMAARRALTGTRSGDDVHGLHQERVTQQDQGFCQAVMYNTTHDFDAFHLGQVQSTRSSAHDLIHDRLPRQLHILDEPLSVRSHLHPADTDDAHALAQEVRGGLEPRAVLEVLVRGVACARVRDLGAHGRVGWGLLGEKEDVAVFPEVPG